MKVFISWSGNRSRAVAQLLNDWIKCVLQATRPWFSPRDIDRGSLWFNEINVALKDTSVGIICLTQENKNKPWILFEAGALAKGLSSSRVCTFLIDLKSTDIQDPLAQFNHSFPEKDSMWELVRTLNATLDDAAMLDERILLQVFDTYWPQFEEKFKELLEQNPPATVTEPRSDESMLAEILENTRSFSSRLRALEQDRSDSVKTRKRERATYQAFVSGTPIVFKDALAYARRALTANPHMGDVSLANIICDRFSLTPSTAVEAVQLAKEMQGSDSYCETTTTTEAP